MGDIKEKRKDANRDPLTGTPGAHPVGVGAGAAGGGVAGAAVGAAVGGPLGAVGGAVVGAVAGGIAGKGAAEAVNPTAEDAYWREHFITTPYHVSGEAYDVYQPAYRHGWESYSRHNTSNHKHSFDEVEPEVRRDWENSPHAKHLTWERAKLAARDAWHRIERKIPGDSDGDGY
jgi:hypothetical protein